MNQNDIELLTEILNQQEFELLECFTYKHLPPALQEVSKPFCDLAKRIVGGDVEATGDILGNSTQGFPLQDGFERINALRKLLESKDSAVRATVIGKRKP